MLATGATSYQQLIAIVMIVISATVATAQDASSAWGLVQKNGLPASQILRIENDHYGNLWMLTFTGTLIRYDGIQFNEFQLPDSIFTNNIYSFAVGHDDKVWLLADIGLIQFDGTNFLTASRLKTSPTYQSEVVVDHTNRPWIINSQGYAFFKRGDSITQFPLGGIKQIIAQDTFTELVTADGAVYTFRSDPNDYTVDSIALNTESFKSLYRTTAVTVVATPKGLCFMKNKKCDRYIPYPDSLGKSVIKIISDEYGRIYALINYKLAIWENDRWVTSDEIHNSPKVRILDLHRDCFGNIWLGTDGSGLYKLERKRVTSYQTEDRVGIWTSIRFNNQIIAGSFGNGLYQVENNTLVKNPGWQALDNTKVVAFHLYNKGVLIATYGKGVWFMDADFKIRQHIDPKVYPSSQLSTYFYAVGDTLFIGTNHGIIRHTKGVVDEFLYKNNSTAMAMIAWNKRMLIGFFTGGLHEFTDSVFTEFPITGLTRASINYLTVNPDSSLWIAANRPYLTRVDYLTGTILRVPIQSNTTVNFIEFLSEYQCIAGTENGVLILNFNSDYTIASTIELGNNNGFIRASGNSGKVWSDSDCLWFGTSAALNCIKLTVPEVQTKSPHTYIRKVTLDGVNEIAKDQYADRYGFYSIPQNVKLTHESNKIAFTFFATDFKQGDQVYFRYRLEPESDSWSDPVRENKIQYLNLSPGSYTFQVQARDLQGSWGQAISYAFEVTPAFWQRPFFYIFVVAATLIFIVMVFLMLYYIRLSQLKRNEEIRLQAAAKVREQVAMDFHDELGNKLAAIVAHANAVRLKQNLGAEELDRLLNYVENNARYIYEGTRDFIWAIDVKSNDLREVVYYIKDFGERLFTGDINFFVSQNLDQLPAVRLQDGYGRHLLLFCKEALTNVFKHSNAQNVWVELTLTNSEVVVSIEDDGIGIRQSNLIGNGLKNFKKRADRIGGNFLIQQRTPNGTIVKLYFKI